MTMVPSVNDPDPGRPKAITNADEQDVAVNHSDSDQGGYSEPSSTSTATVNKSQDEMASKESENDKKSNKGQSSQATSTKH